MLRLIEVVVGTANEGSEIAGVVGHGRILPVNEVHEVVAHKEVRAVEVVVAQAWPHPIALHAFVQKRRLARKLLEIGEQRIGAGAEQLHDAARLLVHVEGPR